jgi:hypothetical protein
LEFRVVSSADTRPSAKEQTRRAPIHGSLGSAVRLRVLREVSTGVGWLLSGKLVALAANGALLFALAALLAPAHFGLIVTTVSAQIIVSRVLLLGTDVATFRVQALEPRWTPHLAGASLRLVLSLIAIATAFAFASTHPIAVRLLPGPWWFGPIVVTGAAGMALHDYVYWRRLAGIGYRAASLMTSGAAMSRLALVMALLIAGAKNPLLLLMAMAIVPLSVSSVLLWRNRPSFRGLPPAAMAVLLRYCGWQASSNILGTIALHQGTLLLSWLREPADAGAFGLAMTVATAAGILTQSLQEFLTARAFRLGPYIRTAKFLAKSVGLASAVSAGLFAALLAAFSLLGLLLRARLSISQDLFVPIAAVAAILVLHTPFEAVCHVLVRPDAILAGKVARLAAGFALGILWGAGHGAVGLARALLVSTVLSLVMIAGFVAWRLAARSPETGRGA